VNDLLLIFALLLWILPIWSALQLYRRAPHRQSVDVSAQQLPPPALIQPTIDRLKRLGFERLGETQIPYNAKITFTLWIFTDTQQQTFAEVALVKNKIPVLEFDSQYEDGAVLQTNYVTFYPMPPKIDEQNFRLHKVTTTVEDTYRQHQEQLASFGLDHSPAVQFHSMEDYLRFIAYYRATFAQRALRPILILKVILPILTLIAFGIVLIMPYWTSVLLPLQANAPRAALAQTSIFMVLLVALGTLIPALFVLGSGVVLLGISVYNGLRNYSLTLKRSREAEA